MTPRLSAAKAHPCVKSSTPRRLHMEMWEICGIAYVLALWAVGTLIVLGCSVR